VEQIYDYHYEYFEDAELGSNTYGGSLLNWLPDSIEPGIKRFMYCQGCDPVAP